MKIKMVPFNPVLGHISENKRRIIEIIGDSTDNDLIVFPEFSLTGYPIQDLVYRDDIFDIIEGSLKEISKVIPENMGVVLGTPMKQENSVESHEKSRKIYNSAIFFQGKNYKEVRKVELPNYEVFDEKRWFTSGSYQPPINFKGYKIGLCICEDIWFSHVSKFLQKFGSDLIIAINASPWDKNKIKERKNVLEQRVLETNLNIFYINMSGGHDELVYDGSIIVAGPYGNKHSIKFHEFDFDGNQSFNYRFDQNTVNAVPNKSSIKGNISTLQEKITSEKMSLYNALKTGLRDYVNKNGFNDVVLGLSGGIDSAFVAALATDALGPEHVHAVLMPSKFTSQESIDLAHKQIENLEINHFSTVHIDNIIQAYEDSMFLPESENVDTTRENLQARIRANILMSISNKYGYMLLSTGNKSEYAVGYSTLYGDMAGGFAPIKDVLKSEIYLLANQRNIFRSYKPIPHEIIERKPSAELRHNQSDEEELLNYKKLDDILLHVLENDQQKIENLKVFNEINSEEIKQVVDMVDKSEFKRKQSAPGTKVSPRSFCANNRRYPLTNGFIKDYKNYG